MKKATGLLKLLRFELPLSAGICVVMGQLLALGSLPSITEILYGFLSIFFISSSILVLNDYFDIETDKINSPDRPIASNIVEPKEALIFSIILFLSGFILGYLISTIAFLCTIVLAVVGILYNSKFKKYGLIGNLLVSFSVGMTFIYGGISVGLPYNKAVWFFGIIAALIDLGEEIAADSADIKGDLLIDSKSLAIKYGKQTAINISFSIFILVVLMLNLPFVLGWFQLIYLVPAGIMEIIIAYSAFKIIKSNDAERRKYIRQIYLGATSGLVIFIILRIVGA